MLGERFVCSPGSFFVQMVRSEMAGGAGGELRAAAARVELRRRNGGAAVLGRVAREFEGDVRESVEGWVCGAELWWRSSGFNGGRRRKELRPEARAAFYRRGGGAGGRGDVRGLRRRVEREWGRGRRGYSGRHGHGGGGGMAGYGGAMPLYGEPRRCGEKVGRRRAV